MGHDFVNPVHFIVARGLDAYEMSSAGGAELISVHPAPGLYHGVISCPGTQAYRVNRIPNLGLGSNI